MSMNSAMSVVERTHDAPGMGASGQGFAVSAPPPPASLNALTLLRALQRRWALALGAGLAGAVLTGALAWAFLPASKFSARTLLRVPPESKFLLATSEPVPDLGNHQRTQLSLVKSRLVLNSALKDPKVSQLSVVQGQVEPVQWLEKNIQADFSVAPEIMRIWVTGDKPDELVALVDGIREAYRREILDKERVDRTERLNILGQLREKHEGRLRAWKDEQRKLEQKAGARNASARALVLAFTQQELHATEKELLQTASALRKAQLELASRDAGEKDAAHLSIPDAVVDEQLDKNPVLQPILAEVQWLQFLMEDTIHASARGEQDGNVQQYRKKIEAKEKEVAGIRKRLRPQVLKTLQDKSKDQLARARLSLKERIAFLEENRNVLLQEVDKLRERVQELTNASIKLDIFQEDMSQKEELTKRIAREEEALKIELQAPSRVRVLEDGVIFQSADPKRPLITAGIAALGGMCCIMFAVSWWEFCARRVSTADELAQGLGIRLIGTIPHTSRRRLGFMPLSEAAVDRLVSESVDTTRAILMELARNGSLRTVLITSAIGGEGKTSLASRLAMSLAQVGYETLLIDGDLRHPKVHAHHGLPNETGFCEALRGEVPWDQLIRPAGTDHLWLLPAGKWTPQASRALARESTAALFAALKERFDLILVDSSPAIAVADPLLISKHVDGVLLSVFCNLSRLPQVYEAYQRLVRAGARVLGAVVSGVSTDIYGYPYSSYLVPPREVPNENVQGLVR